MALSFNGSTSIFKNSSPPVTSRAFSFGAWFWLDALPGVNGSLFSLSSTANTNNYYRVQIGSSGQCQVAVSAGAGTQNVVSTGTNASTGAWHFVLGRFITATNDRNDFLYPNGAIASSSRTVSRSPTVDTMSLGMWASTVNGNFLNVKIGEFWYTNTDVYPDGTATPGSLVRQLAYGGPWSVGHVAAAVQCYISGFVPMDVDGLYTRSDGHIFYSNGAQTWARTAIGCGQHPPLPFDYPRRATNQLPMMMF